MHSKTLLLMRHAKSDHAEPGLKDHDRPLNPRGRRTAPLMARLLHDQALTPDWIVSSTALRAHETAQLVAQSLGFSSTTIDRRRSLYLTTPREYVEVLRTLPDESSRVLVVGHNPTLEELIARWRDEEEAIPTAAIALFELPIDSWSDLQLDTPAQFRELWKPKELDY
ncbi:MAG: histidine phosphatase family protein [Pirellulales bacterium]